MAKLRKGSKQEIMNTLDGTIFTRHAFEAKFGSSDNEVLGITFKENPGFSFDIKHQNGGWYVSEAPGPLLVEKETISLPSLSNCLQRIRPWIDRVLEEIVEVDSVDALKKLRDKLESFAESMPQPDKPFDSNESLEFSSKLDDMVRKFEEMKERDEIQQAQLNELKREVNLLKEEISRLPKKVWVKALGNSVLNILQKGVTKFGEQIGQDAAKQFLTYIIDKNSGT